MHVKVCHHYCMTRPDLLLANEPRDDFGRQEMRTHDKIRLELSQHLRKRPRVKSVERQPVLFVLPWLGSVVIKNAEQGGRMIYHVDISLRIYPANHRACVVELVFSPNFA